MNAEAPNRFRRFRASLLAAMMLLVALVTGLVLFIAERKTQAGYQDALEEKFRSQLSYGLGLEDARRAAVTERCRLLARSARIRAALEEDDPQDLYENALIDLRDVLEPDSNPQQPRFMHANFVRFVNNAGAVLPPRGTELEPWEKKLPAFARSRDAQEAGYISAPDGRAGAVLNQVIGTPVIAADTGLRLGALVLGFRPALFSGGADSQGGILLGNDLWTPAGPDRERGRALRPRVMERHAASGKCQLDIGGVPCLVFYKLLSPESALGNAYQVSIHPLTGALAARRLLRWRISGAGLLILLGGLGASHFASARLVRPVEELAADSAAHQAGREVAEAARELTEQELKVRNQELQKALADLQAAQKQVIQQERLRALGEMASGIAHDFNNALMPITGFSELLLATPNILSDTATARKYLEIIQTGANDAGSVVRRLREFYRPNEKSDHFGAVMLNRVVKQAAALTRPKWKDQAQANGADIAVRTQLDDHLPVMADEAALRELLTNLIFNAVDAMPQGGKLFLKAHCEPEWGVLEVRDTGTGMTEEVRQRCLEPFYSTKGERGTGLGLSMVFGIVQRHHGTIGIESKAGEGTAFIIRLPLHRQDSAACEEQAKATGARGLHVLVVDDEPQVRDVLCAYLNLDGHDCETAPHAIDGLHRFREGRFDLVIADKAMPGMSGDQMAAAIKQLAPGTPVVLLTGFGSFLAPETMPGVDVLAEKPITLPSLREAIGKAMAA